MQSWLKLEVYKMILRNNFMILLFSIVLGRIILYASNYLAPYNIIDSNPFQKLIYIIAFIATCFAISYTTTSLTSDKEWVINLLSIILVPLLFTIGLLIQNPTLLYLGYGPFGILTVGFSQYQWPVVLASYAGFGYMFLKINDFEGGCLRKYALVAIAVVSVTWLIRAYLAIQYNLI